MTGRRDSSAAVVSKPQPNHGMPRLLIVDDTLDTVSLLVNAGGDMDIVPFTEFMNTTSLKKQNHYIDVGFKTGVSQTENLLTIGQFRVSKDPSRASNEPGYQKFVTFLKKVRACMKPLASQKATYGNGFHILADTTTSIESLKMVLLKIDQSVIHFPGGISLSYTNANQMQKTWQTEWASAPVELLTLAKSCSIPDFSEETLYTYSHQDGLDARPLPGAFPGPKKPSSQVSKPKIMHAESQKPNLSTEDTAMREISNQFLTKLNLVENNEQSRSSTASQINAKVIFTKIKLLTKVIRAFDKSVNATLESSNPVVSRASNMVASALSTVVPVIAHQALKNPTAINRMLKEPNPNFHTFPASIMLPVNPNPRKHMFNTNPLLIRMVHTLSSLARQQKNLQQVHNSVYTAFKETSAYTVVGYGTYEENKVAYLLLEEHSTNRLLVVFRGTNSALDYLIDMFATKSVFVNPRIVPNGSSTQENCIKVHDGVEASINNMKNNYLFKGTSSNGDVITEVVPDLTEYLVNRMIEQIASNPNASIVFTGHSLGTGQCTLSLYYFLNHLSVTKNTLIKSNVYLDVYSCMRCGNGYYYQWLANNLRKDRYFSYRIMEDIVPLLSIDFADGVTSFSMLHEGRPRDNLDLSEINGNIVGSPTILKMVKSKYPETIFKPSEMDFTHPKFNDGLEYVSIHHAVEQYMYPAAFNMSRDGMRKSNKTSARADRLENNYSSFISLL